MMRIIIAITLIYLTPAFADIVLVNLQQKHFIVIYQKSIQDQGEEVLVRKCSTMPKGAVPKRTCLSKEEVALSSFREFELNLSKGLALEKFHGDPDGLTSLMLEIEDMNERLDNDELADEATFLSDLKAKRIVQTKLIFLKSIQSSLVEGDVRFAYDETTPERKDIYDALLSIVTRQNQDSKEDGFATNTPIKAGDRVAMLRGGAEGKVIEILKDGNIVVLQDWGGTYTGTERDMALSVKCFHEIYVNDMVYIVPLSTNGTVKEIFANGKITLRLTTNGEIHKTTMKNIAKNSLQDEYQSRVKEIETTQKEIETTQKAIRKTQEETKRLQSKLRY